MLSNLGKNVNFATNFPKKEHPMRRMLFDYDGRDSCLGKRQSRVAKSLQHLVYSADQS